MTTVPQPDDLDASYTCAYDAWNRLVEVKDGERVHARYEYDALNRRVKAHVDSDSAGGPDTWVHFYYTNEWQLLETRRTTSTGGAGGSENDAPDNLQPHRQYVWSVRYTDALVRRDTNTNANDHCDDETLYALGDANFNTTALVNTAGTVLERYVYDPYGRVTVTDGTWTGRAGSLYESMVLFAGYWRDTETGLYHVRNRMYHVRLGLWLTRDPEGYVDEMSLYAYVAVNPIGRCDPSGRLSWDDAEYAYRQVKNGVPNAFARPVDAVKGYYKGLGASVSSVGRNAASMGVELVGLGLDTVSAAQALSDGGRPTGESIIPRLDPGTMEFADGGNRAAGLATGIATDPLGVGKAVVGGMAETIGGTLIGDPEAGGALALDCGISLATMGAGKGFGLFDDVGRSADDIARHADDLARHADDFADEAAGAANNGVKWNNGWRTPDGRFASPQGPGRAGAAAESTVWDAVEAKSGWSIRRGPVAVRDASGQLRVFDGAAISPKGRAIGLEVKSGTSPYRGSQRAFGSVLNSSGADSLQGLGNNRDLWIRRALGTRR
mgnify:CR=1 FL=1